MFLGVYYDDAFERPVLKRHHALSVNLNLAKQTLFNVLQYDALNGRIENYLDADNEHLRQIVSAHISSFRLVATLQYASLHCVSLSDLANMCASLQQSSSPTHSLNSSFQVSAVSRPLHPSTLRLFQQTFTVLDDSDKFTNDYS